MESARSAAEQPEHRSAHAASQSHLDWRQLVSFRIDKEEFGLEILSVQEIIRVQHLTRVPNSPEFVDGVINLRGKVIPVVGLRKRFGLDELAHDNQTRIVVVQVKETTLGLIVDSVSEVLRISADQIESPPRLRKVEREYVSGVARVGQGLLILLNLDRLLSESEEISCTQLQQA